MTLVTDPFQFTNLLWRETAVTSLHKTLQSNIYNTVTAQHRHAVIQCVTHTADLTVQSLCQDNVKASIVLLPYLARLCDSIEDLYALGHFL